MLNLLHQRNNIKGKISKIMETIILNLWGLDNILDILSAPFYKSFITKGRHCN